MNPPRMSEMGVFPFKNLNNSKKKKKEDFSSLRNKSTPPDEITDEKNMTCLQSI